MNRLAIFDCDGTLVDSGATITRAVAETFAAHGMTAPPPRECRRVIGLSLTEAMAALVPEASCDEHIRLSETYKANFFAARVEGRVEEPLFDGIADLLDLLEADGWLLGVATGKSLRGLAHCLESLGIAGRFVSLQTADRHPSKPHPSMIHQALADSGASAAESLMIGDTSYDMAMAVAAGAVPVGVAWGYHDADDLVAAGAVTVAQTPAQILSFAREMDDG